MTFRRTLVATIGLLGILWAPHDAWSGPVFDSVMKRGSVRLGIPYNLRPQGFLTPEGEWLGFEKDLGAELASRMNLKLEPVKVNGQTWKSMLAGGQIDAALCRIRHTRSLDAEFDASIAYFYDSLQMLVTKGNAKTGADLKGLKIAAIQGSPAEKVAMHLLTQAGDPEAQKNVISFPDRPSCFAALGQDKVSGWVDSGMILLEYASRSPGRFELAPVSEKVEPLAIALPQNDSAWRNVINFTIQDMAADGSLAKLYDKWFGPDTPYPFPARRAIEIWPQ